MAGRPAGGPRYPQRAVRGLVPGRRYHHGPRLRGDGIHQAKSWVIGDTNGFAPQHPADIVADLVVLLEAYQEAADQVDARA